MKHGAQSSRPTVTVDLSMRFQGAGSHIAPSNGGNVSTIGNTIRNDLKSIMTNMETS